MKLANISPKTDVENTQNIITVDDIAIKWLKKIKLCKKYSTYIKYETIYNVHIKPILATKRIDDITTADWLLITHSKYYSDNNENNLSYSTICSIRNVLTQILKCCNKQISFPLERKQLSLSTNSNAKHIQIFTREEQDKLKKYLLTDIDSYKLGIYICMLTGLRLGEICALRTDNIDLKSKTITVSQTVQRIKDLDFKTSKTKLNIDEPKTKNSHRVIPICDILVSILTEYVFIVK